LLTKAPIVRFRLALPTSLALWLTAESDPQRTSA
jgi:hypothetical protein